MMRENTVCPEWTLGGGPHSGIILSTRARLARSLSDIPFPACASGEDLVMAAEMVREACVGLRSKMPDLRCFSVDKLGSYERSYLLDAHLASIEHLAGGEGRAVVLEPTGRLSIMVNEEDHIRIQSVQSGLACREAWEVADWADDVLGAKLDYGYSAKYGYLTASVSNVGTGLRVSALMHLAGLTISNRLNSQLRAAHDLGVSIRGVFGEGTQAIGDLVQVSNEVTLGCDEPEIVEKVRSMAEYLLEEELCARKELLGEDRKRIVDAASRSLRTLQCSMSLKPDQALKLLSPLRLCAECGLTKGLGRRELNLSLIHI